MRLDISQQMRAEQRMVLAPRMIQSMEILQLPLLALQERIEQEMLTNPVLEEELPADFDSPPPANEQTSQEVPEGERLLQIGQDDSKKGDFERLENIGNDYDDYLGRSSYITQKRTNGERDAKLDAMQNTAAPNQSLNDYLHEQWLFMEADEIIKKAGTVIIDNLDDSGYLTTDLQSLTEQLREPVKPEQMNLALQLVQTLDPPGIGARDMAQCMLLQLRNQPEPRTLEIELVSNHLKDIEMNRYPAIAKKTGKTIKEIQDAVKVISQLDPRPGMQIGSHENQYIVPDIIVDYDEEDDIYTARLSDGSSPNLRISSLYAGMIKDKKTATDAKEFLQNSVRSARWLIESIEQRKTTLLRVVNHVLKNQRDFFDHGPLHLKPLPMVEVAEALGIHVGTVSRAVSGKYLQTPIGIFPLRSFFSGGTENAAGESVSWDAIKAKLQEIIDNEDKNNPLSDDKLVEELVRQGLTVARRTVAKYRGLLNIPPARRRKEYS
ncbi:MAG: RNA polymerase factor sigma-54 [Sedimentisphaerales bacterium]|nr:RNA polymerase factor sigma-54 [Sedimentisphaerales bacterium]